MSEQGRARCSACLILVAWKSPTNIVRLPEFTGSDTRARGQTDSNLMSLRASAGEGNSKSR